MKCRFLNFALVLLMAGVFLGAGCAWLSGESDQLARIHPFSPTMLSDQTADAIRRFKAGAGGERVAEGTSINTFLPKALNRDTFAINYKKLPYRLGRDQVEKMLGPPDAVSLTSPSIVKSRPGFIVLEYKMDAGRLKDSIDTTGSLWITLYKGWVVDSEIPGIIFY